MPAALLHEVMNDVQEFRDSLDLVHHDIRSLSAQHELAEAFRSCGQFPVEVGPQEVHEVGVRQAFPEPTRFSRATRAEEEEAALRERNESRYKCHNESPNGK